MIATEAETLGEVRVFCHQAHAIHRVVRQTVEGITQEESLIQPQPQGNCLNWIMGHLVYVYDQILPLLGQEPVLGVEALKRYERGTEPLKNAAEALDLARLMAAWDEAGKRVEAGLTSLTPEILAQPAPWSPTKNPEETVGSLLSIILFHQGYHAGQIALLSRMAGKQRVLG